MDIYNFSTKEVEAKKFIGAPQAESWGGYGLAREPSVVTLSTLLFGFETTYYC